MTDMTLTCTLKSTSSGCSNSDECSTSCPQSNTPCSDLLSATLQANGFQKGFFDFLPMLWRLVQSVRREVIVYRFGHVKAWCFFLVQLTNELPCSPTQISNQSAWSNRCFSLNRPWKAALWTKIQRKWRKCVVQAKFLEIFQHESMANGQLIFMRGLTCAFLHVKCSFWYATNPYHQLGLRLLQCYHFNPLLMKTGKTNSLDSNSTNLHSRDFHFMASVSLYFFFRSHFSNPTSWSIDDFWTSVSQTSVFSDSKRVLCCELVQICGNLTNHLLSDIQIDQSFWFREGFSTTLNHFRWFEIINHQSWKNSHSKTCPSSLNWPSCSKDI